MSALFAAFSQIRLYRRRRQQHQPFGYFDSIDRTRHHLLQHTGSAQFVNVSCKKVQYSKDPKHRQERTGLSEWFFISGLISWFVEEIWGAICLAM